MKVVEGLGALLVALFVGCTFVLVGALVCAFYTWPLIVLAVGGRYMGWW